MDGGVYKRLRVDILTYTIFFSANGFLMLSYLYGDRELLPYQSIDETRNIQVVHKAMLTNMMITLQYFDMTSKNFWVISGCSIQGVICVLKQIIHNVLLYE